MRSRGFLSKIIPRCTSEMLLRRVESASKKEAVFMDVGIELTYRKWLGRNLRMKIQKKKGEVENLDKSRLP